ncbi:MAG: trigger factor, partial [Gammaproteobacteria bacterium]|nr:trigger factor [Gammaproteobacteria bacterium]
MQVSVETKGPLERSVTVDVPEERIAGAVEEQLKSMSRTSRVQGFRPGKAPMRVIKQRFGPQVRKEVVEKLVSSSFFEAMNQEDLKPVGRPLIDPLREEVGGG